MRPFAGMWRTCLGFQAGPRKEPGQAGGRADGDACNMSAPSFPGETGVRCATSQGPGKQHGVPCDVNAPTSLGNAIHLPGKATEEEVLGAQEPNPQ